MLHQRFRPLENVETLSSCAKTVLQIDTIDKQVLTKRSKFSIGSYIQKAARGDHSSYFCPQPLFRRMFLCPFGIITSKNGNASQIPDLRESLRHPLQHIAGALRILVQQQNPVKSAVHSPGACLVQSCGESKVFRIGNESTLTVGGDPGNL